jgi:integrase/recombinase XerC
MKFRIDHPVDKEVGNIINQFIMHTVAELYRSKNTILSYLRDLKSFLEFLSKHYKTGEVSLKELNSLTTETIRLWLNDRYDKGITKNSSNRSLSALRTFFTFLSDNDILNNKAIFGVKKAKLPKLLPKALDNSGIDSLIDGVKNLDKKLLWINLRNEALILLLFSTGMRISEALSITRDMVKKDHLLIKGKGNKERIVPLLKVVNDKIHDYLMLCPYVIMENDVIFRSRRGGKYDSRSAQRLFTDARRKIGLSEDVTPHVIRHTCATTLLENSNDLHKIQKLLGHSLLSTTQIYTKVTKRNLINELSEIDYWE